MPSSPALYPTDWPHIAREIKEACSWCCQQCGRQCRRPGEFNFGWEYHLTVAHYYHEYDSPSAFVVALCAKCHLLHDAPFVWHARRRWARHRLRAAGQLEMEYSY
jgi:hypothetical protein